MFRDNFFKFFGDHLQDIRPEVGPAEDFSPLAINEFTVFIDDIIVLHQVFTHVEMKTFNAHLGVFNGLIDDKFAPILKNKMHDLGSHVTGIEFAPDNVAFIRQAIEKHIKSHCDVILLSGGMSVDPDDVTRKGIHDAGATEMYYGAAALPGAMFMVAYINDIPLLGVPACGLHHKVTVLDLILPRILIGERIGKKELAFIGHGGLCMDCPECTHPHCPFGKGM